MVIMNPPFTSDTKHQDSDQGVLNAAFAAFNATEVDQKKMAARLKKLAKETCYHGHAGLGSAFSALAEKKVKPGGVIAFVLPFTAINGSSWEKFREMIAKHFTDVTVVSIAANGMDMSFSSETGIAECLIVGRKLPSNGKPKESGTFVSLRRRSENLVESQGISRVTPNGNAVRHLEDGPYGGLSIYLGSSLIGEILAAPVVSHEGGWGAARVVDAAVAQIAHALSNGRLWPPAMPRSIAIPMVQLRELGQLGVHDSMLILDSHKGPFDLSPPSATATYPALWNHDAKAENTIVCLPDSALQVKPGQEKRAGELWATASHAHITRGFRFNSQPLVVAFTRELSVGGRAWPNVKFKCKDYDATFALWGNTTLGMLCYWWHSSRQVAGRGDMTRLSIPLLSTLDLRTLTDAQLVRAEEIFNDFRDKELLPAYLADADPNRALLDKRVICDLLGFDDDIYQGVRRLAAKWCAEPSVHGGKKRPASAKFVA